MNKKIVIAGAGLAGLSAAWHLKQRGLSSRIFEQEGSVGGLCRSQTVNGFTFDCDAHLLHFRHQESLRLVRRFLGQNLKCHARSAWVFLRGAMVQYPFQANLYGLPERVAQECLLGLIRARKNGSNGERANFLRWIERTFGSGIARHFMVPYNAKFWTVPPRELTCEWLDGFIPVPTLTQVIEGTLKPSRRRFGYNATFWYPRAGAAMSLPKAIAAEVPEIHLDCGITGIDLLRRQVSLSNGKKERYDYLVSTIPLPELPRLIRRLPRSVQEAFGKLRWNSIFNLNLGLEAKALPKRHWIYFPEEKLSFFRVGFYHTFSGALAPPGCVSLYVEYAHAPQAHLETRNLIRRLKRDLVRTGLLSGNERVLAENHNRIGYGYPIYDRQYQAARDAITAFLHLHNVIPCGRYGSWKYFSMEDALLDGARVAQLL